MTTTMPLPLSPVRARPARVVVLLGLHDGARYLDAQLASLAGQSLPDWELIVSDDGSRDGGPAAVRRFASAIAPHSVSLMAGPRMGFARNYLGLLEHVPRGTPYAALCDQDDVWLPDKLARAVAAVARLPAGRPGLYCSASWVCDAHLGNRRRSRRLHRPPAFAHALVQSIAGGNTMVLNRAALTLVQGAAREVGEVVAHDWWLYQIVAGAGGTVIYDPEPGLLYRQHGGNQFGANSGPTAAVARARMVLGGRFHDWTDVNIKALQASAHRLTEANRTCLQLFSDARQLPLVARIAALRRVGVYRHSRLSTAGLWGLAVLGRL